MASFDLSTIASENIKAINNNTKALKEMQLAIDNNTKAIMEMKSDIRETMKHTTSIIVQAINEVHEVTTKTNNNIDNYRSEIHNNITRLQNQMQHIDKGLELEITNTVSNYLQTIATRYSMKYTYKMGKNFIKKLVTPFENNVITDLDGCYILTNTTSNAKFANSTRLKKHVPRDQLETQLQMYLKEMQTANVAKKRKLQEKLTKIQKLKAKDDAEVIENNLEEIILEMELETVTPLPNKRYICIVEAKTYLSEDELLQQAAKMERIIEYFKQVYLYHAKEYNKGWTKEFITTNQQFNLLFDGIILMVGGKYYVESVMMETIDVVQENINKYIENQKESLIDETDFEFYNKLDCKCFVVLPDRIIPELDHSVL